MKREMKDDSEKKPSISLLIPALNPNLFKHKATNDILLFLYRHRWGEFTLSELATHTGYTQPSIKRSVDVLEENGIVVDEPKGNQRSIQINRERLSVPDDPYLQIPQREFQKPVKVAAEELEDRLEDVQAIVLYGSVARGEADRRSDIDLWVLVSKDRPENQRRANEVVMNLEEREFDGDRYTYDVDVESVSSIPKYTEDIRQIVLSGIPVYETEKFRTVEKLLMNELEDQNE